MFRWIVSPRRRSYWRSVMAGLLSHYLAVAFLIALLFLVRRLFWAVLYGNPYLPEPGPVDPTSNEGTLLQCIGLLSWVPAGAAALHWSATRAPWGLLTLVLYLLALMLVGVSLDLQPAMPLGRAIWYYLSAPLGLALGAAAYLVTHRRAQIDKSTTPAGQRADA